MSNFFKNFMHYLQRNLAKIENRAYNKETDSKHLLNICRNGGGFMYNALDIAKQILIVAKRENIPITNMKLQKLLYYIQGLCIKAFDCLAFHDEIQAWQYGPVVPSVYDEYKHYIAEEIEIDFELNDIVDEKQILAAINAVVYRMGNRSAWSLVDKTHEEKPWLDNYMVGQKNVISEQDMRNYFGKL